MKTRIFSIFILIVILTGSLLLAGCNALNAGTAAKPTDIPLVAAPAGVIAEGRVLPLQDANLTSRSGGRVVEILVTEGDSVQQGDVLVRLGDREPLEAALEGARAEKLAAEQAITTLNEKAGLMYQQALLAVKQAEAALIDAREQLWLVDTTTRQDDIDQAREDAASLDKDLEDAQKEADRYKDLEIDNPTRKTADDDLKETQRKVDEAVRKVDQLVNELESAKTAVETAQARLDDANVEAEKLVNGPKAEDMDLAKARLTAAEAQLAAAQYNLDQLELKAPIDGEVLDIRLDVGDMAVANQTILVMADQSGWMVETTDLTETDVVNVKVGQEVEIRPDALDGIVLKGSVESIDRTFVERGGDILYTVHIRLDDTDPLLRWGMTVEVLILE